MRDKPENDPSVDPEVYPDGQCSGHDQAEEAARSYFFAQARSLPGCNRMNLREVFQLHGASSSAKGGLGVLPYNTLIEACRQALEGCDGFDGKRRNVGMPRARIVARRIAATTKAAEGVDFRSFEDWLQPPRSVSALWQILTGFIQKSVASGRKVTDIFSQLLVNDSKRPLGEVDVEEAKRERFQTDLAQMGFFMTGTEVDVIVKAAKGADAGNEGSPLTLEMLSTYLSRGDDEQFFRRSFVELCPVNDDGQNMESVSPQRLGLRWLTSTPSRRIEDRYAESVSAFSRVQAFEVSAADVQRQVMSGIGDDTKTTVLQSCDDGDRTILEGLQSKEFGSDPPEPDTLQMQLPSRRAWQDAVDGTNENAPAQQEGDSNTISDGPCPRIQTRTPPFGSARSSQPLHPTRASRERLEEALESLDLKEHLRPSESSVVFNELDPGYARNDAEAIDDGRKDAQNDASRTVDGGIGDSLSRRQQMLGDRDTPSTRSSREDRTIRATLQLESNAHQQTSCRGYDEENRPTAQDAATGDPCRDRPEDTIGKLRARVAELELSEELLRHELSSSRADMAEAERRAEHRLEMAVAAVREQAKAARSRMTCRIRERDAEVTAITKRMNDSMKSASAEATVRNRSAAEYIRRRVKDAETAFEAKLKSRLKERSLARNAHSAGRGDKGRFSADTARWGRHTRDGKERTHALVHQLEMCRKKLALTKAEVSRLRLREGKEAGKRYQGAANATHASSLMNTSYTCDRDWLCRLQAKVSNLSSKLAKSEDSRLEAEAESRRLQAFLDEMRELGSSVRYGPAD